MLTNQQITFVVEVLYKARTDKQVKLRLGTRQRARLLEAINADKLDKTDYRYVWVNEARQEIFKTLRSEAVRFDSAHPHDSISVADFVDVIESVLLVLKTHN
jgi:hypothetical protein